MMSKTRDEEALHKGAPAVVYNAPVIAAAAVATPNDGPESLPCVLASPVLYDYGCPSILNSSFSEDGGSDGEGGVPLAAACCYPDSPAGSRDVIAQNVDLFDLNMTVHVEVAGQVCEPVEAAEPQLDLTEEEAALLLDLMDKSMISPKAAPDRREESIAKPPSDNDSAELDNIVLDMYFEDSEKYEQTKYCPGQRFEIPDTGPRPVSPPPTEATYNCALGGHGGAAEETGEGRAAAEGKKRKREQGGGAPKAPRTAKQIATSKRARANGQFVRCKIKWVPACALSNEGIQGGS